MRDNMCAASRRMEIIEILRVRKNVTRNDLAKRFNVSKRTISRDIVSLSLNAPIYTVSGKQGGIYIISERMKNKNYLTENEEQCLLELMYEVNESKRILLKQIVSRFTKNY